MQRIAVIHKTFESIVFCEKVMQVIQIEMGTSLGASKDNVAEV